MAPLSSWSVSPAHNAAGERPAPACRRGWPARRIHHPLPGQGDYPPGLTHGMLIGLGVLLLLVAIIGYWGFLRRHGRGGASLAEGSRPEHGDAHRHQRA